ncbi:voltage-gated hydrogen channel 1 [Benincasa hispida]|uniref:voltage-gated hydrogen channel 1 n=1 Tax=Benincasa hispida TaxID=102211 RepID=UPI0019009FFB|nr:voltage-gated hydrogen channel 1 [Benincasa hispida]
MAILSNFLNSTSPLQSATTTTTTIESLESSIHDVVKLYERRKKWRSLFVAPNTNSIDTFSSWRVHLITLLESTPAHVITIVLLVMDLIITVLELSSSLISCGSHGKEEEKMLYFHWVSIAILSFLSAKTTALMVGLGCSFFRRSGCVVDGVVAVVALVLEVAAERKGGGVIMMASLWRLVRVVESAFELSDDAIEVKIEEIVWELERMKEEIRRQKEKDELMEML